MPMGLTPRQLDCARAIHEYVETLGRPPTWRELCAELDLASLEGVSRLVGGLEERGWVRRERPGRGAVVELLHAPPMPEEPAVEVTAAGRDYLAGAGVA